MKYTIQTVGHMIPAEIKQLIANDFRALEVYFQEDTEMEIILSDIDGNKTAQASILMDNMVIRTEQSSANWKITVDLVAEVLERKVMRYRKQLITNYHQEVFAGTFAKAAGEPETENTTELPEEEEIVISRTKQYDPAPMTPEEAALRMEIIGHQFFAFRNSRTDKITTIYKRKNGTYGLLEPR